MIRLVQGQGSGKNLDETTKQIREYKRSKTMFGGGGWGGVGNTDSLAWDMLDIPVWHLSLEVHQKFGCMHL